MGREIKRVAAGFDWPVGKLWSGYVNPYRPRQCEACGGIGLSPLAKRMQAEWYGQAPFNPQSMGSRPFTHHHPVVRERAKRNVLFDLQTSTMREPTHADAQAILREAHRLATDCFDSRWMHHLSQADVNALVEGGRLWEFTRRPRTPEQESKLKAQAKAGGSGYWLGEWNGYTPTAEEVNLWSIQFGIGHDSINQWICVQARCKREGKPYHCLYCNGTGSDPADAETYAKQNDWTRTDPPAGEWYQLWSTTTEGHPMTPAFATPRELARYCVEAKVSSFGHMTESYETWLSFISGRNWAPSMVVTDGAMSSGVAAAVEQSEANA